MPGKRGQTVEDISREFCVPVRGRVFAGAVILLPRGDFTMCSALLGNSFASVAAFGVGAEELARINGGKTVYPMRMLFIFRAAQKP